MSFGSKVKKTKERTLEVSASHITDHLRAFLLAGGLVGRDEVLVSSTLPPNIKIILKKVKLTNGQEG